MTNQPAQLIMATYALRIWDERGEGASQNLGGYLAPYIDKTKFALYYPASATPYDREYETSRRRRGAIALRCAIGTMIIASTVFCFVNSFFLLTPSCRVDLPDLQRLPLHLLAQHPPGHHVGPHHLLLGMGPPPP